MNFSHLESLSHTFLVKGRDLIGKENVSVTCAPVPGSIDPSIRLLSAFCFCLFACLLVYLLTFLRVCLSGAFLFSYEKTRELLHPLLYC